MSIMRTALLHASRSAWLARQVRSRRFAQRAVARFMPGEDADAALRASEELRSSGITTVLTQLGEDIEERGEAEAVTEHYLGVLDAIARRSLRSHVSVKLTQLGLDITADICRAQVETIVTRAEELENIVWIDMEGSDHVDATIEIFRAVQEKHQNVGLCLQAYLHRTPDDLSQLLSVGARIRLVKGAYREPPSVAMPRKADVDARFLELAKALLADDARRAGVVPGIATHDMRLVATIRGYARERGLPTDACEVQMLYGIGTKDQRRLAAEGGAIRVLISYGAAWFPWYMRRLAERPANLWFVLRSLV